MELLHTQVHWFIGLSSYTCIRYTTVMKTSFTCLQNRGTRWLHSRFPYFLMQNCVVVGDFPSLSLYFYFSLINTFQLSTLDSWFRPWKNRRELISITFFPPSKWVEQILVLSLLSFKVSFRSNRLYSFRKKSSLGIL